MATMGRFRWAAPLALGLTLVSAACAQQSGSRPSQQSGGSGMNMQGHDMSSMQGHDMSGMQGHDMGGMDMQAMMNHCADMRQQVRLGAAMSPDMRSMIAQCDQMDQQMGGTSGAPRTRTR